MAALGILALDKEFWQQKPGRNSFTSLTPVHNKGSIIFSFRIQSRTPSLKGQHCHSLVRTMPKVTGPGIRATRFHGAPANRAICTFLALSRVATGTGFYPFLPSLSPHSEKAENEGVKIVSLISIHRFYLQILGGGGSSWR